MCRAATINETKALAIPNSARNHPVAAGAGNLILIDARLSSRSTRYRFVRRKIDPDERVAGAIRLVFEKFREHGSCRQVHLWFLDSGLSLPVVRRNVGARHIEWRRAAYHTVHQILKNPIYAGTYAFGRRGTRTRIVDGRARKTTGHHRAMADWGELLRDNHEGYITWERFEENQRMILENAHMKKLTSRKSGRGGRALLTGLARCGRCGRMMQVFYQGGWVGSLLPLPVPGKLAAPRSVHWHRRPAYRPRGRHADP